MLAQKLIDPAPLSLTDKIRLINRDSKLSKGGKLLAIEIIIASNWRGYCWHSVAALGEMISSSETQVHSYLKELETKEFIKIVRRPGTTNRYYLGPKFVSTDLPENPNQGVRNSTPKIETKYKENVNNVFSKSSRTKENDYTDQVTTTPIGTKTNSDKPAPNLFNMGLVKQILDLTNDKKSVGCYIKIVRTVPETVIYTALSSLKIALTEGIVSNRGAYFVQTIKNHYPEVFSQPKTSSVTVLTSNERSITHLKPTTEPVLNLVEQPASLDESLAAIAKIKQMLSRIAS